MFDDHFLTVEQVAQTFRVTPQTIRNWIKGGMLPATKYGKSYRVLSEDVTALLADGQVAGASPEAGVTSPGTVAGSARGDVWAPETLELPRRREAEPPSTGSIWEDTGVPVRVRKRG
jgi:excisionase family DNA binding protein